MKGCPCKGCGERIVEPNCHDACPVSARGAYGYDEWKADMLSEKEARRKDSEVISYNHDKTKRLWKRMNWKRDGQL